MNNELTKALEMLYDMEKNNYYMTRSIEKLDVEIQKLGIRKDIDAPKKFYSRSTAEDIAGICLIISVLFSVFCFFVYEHFSGNFLMALLIGFLSFIPFFLVSFVIGYAISGVTADKEAELRYERAFEAYEKEKRLDNERVEKEFREKEFLISQKQSLLKRKNEASVKLNSFYFSFNIAEEFRNIIPLGYMYEFARLGVSTKLEGVDGLYYLIHKELRADCFQLSLDEISRKLDTIIDNQRNISVELKLLNDKCDTIIEHTKKEAEQSARNNELLNKAVENTEIAKYNSERIAKELEYQTFIELWDIKGSYFN
ncbi:MAG: hypothetical protein IJF57_02180 [Clostridia bacterium]|nr:hypothetical protein [Clostridia bacterium]